MRRPQWARWPFELVCVSHLLRLQCINKCKCIEELHFYQDFDVHLRVFLDRVPLIKLTRSICVLGVGLLSMWMPPTPSALPPIQVKIAIKHDWQWLSFWQIIGYGNLWVCDIVSESVWPSESGNLCGLQKVYRMGHNPIDNMHHLLRTYSLGPRSIKINKKWLTKIPQNSRHLHESYCSLGRRKCLSGIRCLFSDHIGCTRW